MKDARERGGGWEESYQSTIWPELSLQVCVVEEVFGRLLGLSSKPSSANVRKHDLAFRRFESHKVYTLSLRLVMVIYSSGRTGWHRPRNPTESTTP